MAAVSYHIRVQTKAFELHHEGCRVHAMRDAMGSRHDGAASLSCRLPAGAQLVRALMWELAHDLGLYQHLLIGLHTRLSGLKLARSLGERCERFARATTRLQQAVWYCAECTLNV